MPVEKKLLEILCCPATKVSVKELDSARLEKLNAAVSSGNVAYEGGESVSAPVEEALITEDGKTVYEVRNGIPMMLVEKGIPTGQIAGF